MQIGLPDGTTAPAEVMQRPSERAIGLMYRTHQPDGQLMLFRYKQSGEHRIWMKNCLFAIDVAWIDKHGKVMAVMTDVPPCAGDPCPVFGPRYPSRHFIEGASGWIDAHQVTPGAVLSMGPITPHRPDIPAP